jgi:hypothetical protein
VVYLTVRVLELERYVCIGLQNNVRLDQLGSDGSMVNKEGSSLRRPSVIRRTSDVG